MNNEQRGPTPILRTIALFAIPVVVAVAVAALVLSARDKDAASPPIVTSATSDPSASSDQSTTTITADPKVANFCRDTAAINAQMQAAAKRFSAQDAEIPAPDEIADLIQSFDLTAIDIDQTPDEMKDDLRYVVERRDEAVAEIRGAPDGTPVTQLLPMDLIERFTNVIEYHFAHCSGLPES